MPKILYCPYSTPVMVSTSYCAYQRSVYNILSWMSKPTGLNFSFETLHYNECHYHNNETNSKCNYILHTRHRGSTSSTESTAWHIFRIKATWHSYIEMNMHLYASNMIQAIRRYMRINRHDRPFCSVFVQPKFINSL